jgi:hypothetical protein
MKASRFALCTGLVLSSLYSTACTNPSGDTTGSVTLTLVRNGVPASGVQAILQNEAGDADIGSGLSNSSGKITSASFTGTMRATFVDTDSSSNSYLFTMRDIKAGSTLTVNLPQLSAQSVGSVKYTVPALYAGADTYIVYALSNNNDNSDYIPQPMVPGTARTMNINNDAVMPNNTVTLVAVAEQNVGSAEKIIAYSFLNSVDYAPTGQTPTSIQTFGAWQTNLEDVSLTIAGSEPSGFAQTNSFAQLNQFTKGKELSVFAFSSPSTQTSLPQDYSFTLIPGLSDTYVLQGSVSDSTNGSVIAMFKQGSTLPSNTSWNPGASPLPFASKITTDSSAPASAPRFTFTQVGTATGVADAALGAVQWTSGGKTYAWYAVSAADSVDAAHAFGFPALPAAFAAYVPPSGTVFYQAIMVYVDYNDSADYDSFLTNHNLDVLTFHQTPGQSGEIDVAGAEGTP